MPGNSPAADRVRRQWLWYWAIAVAILVEGITLYLRFGLQRTAAEFNRTAPLVLQMHHMFWSAPLLVILPFAWNHPRLSGWLAGVSAGFIASDLAHHFLVLPLLIGDICWHWP